MPAPKLLLVKHAAPLICPDVPAHQWHLAQGGIEKASQMASVLQTHTPQALASSREPKANETAAIIGDRLGLPVEIISGLHEHERSHTPFSEQAAFEAAVRACLCRPGELVYGDETADQAYSRFSAAIEHFLAQHPGQTVAVVAHGTVISLFVSRHCGLEPFTFWRKLGLPALVILSRPDLALIQVVESI